MLEKWKLAWHNAYYRGFALYIAVIVTLIFGFQLYRYFVSDPAGHRCTPHVALLSWIGG